MPEDNQKELGPAHVSFATFLLKILASAAGGIGGSLIMAVIFFLAASVFEPLSNPNDINQVSPIFIFIMMMMVFLSSTAGNILSTWLLALTEREKYSRLSSAIFQIFILSVITLVILAPIYFLTKTNITGYVVALHIIISAQISALILEIVSDYRYSLVGLYGVTFSVLVSAGILFFLAGVIQSPQLLLFISLPVVWGSIAVVSSLTTNLYGWIARTYDKDFLSTQTVYGQDYGKAVEDEEEQAPQAEDEAGEDFLRHN